MKLQRQAEWLGCQAENVLGINGLPNQKRNPRGNMDRRAFGGGIVRLQGGLVGLT